MKRLLGLLMVLAAPARAADLGQCCTPWRASAQRHEG
jgi:hypothetical protein